METLTVACQSDFAASTEVFVIDVRRIDGDTSLAVGFQNKSAASTGMSLKERTDDELTNLNIAIELRRNFTFSYFFTSFHFSPISSPIFKLTMNISAICHKKEHTIPLQPSLGSVVS